MHTRVNSITIPRWFDRHIHIRDGRMMGDVLPETLRQRATGAVIMPNLEVPITTISLAFAYRERIRALVGNSDFAPIMTLYLTDRITPEEVVHGFEEGAWQAVKLYMADQEGKGGTTGSQHGVRFLRGRDSVFAAMEKHGIPLLGHFEAVETDVDEFDREAVSLERDLIPLLRDFPGLIVVVEHITDGRMADFVATSNHKTIYATVTAHHLHINRNAMFRGGMNSVHFCKPVPKRDEHRWQVRQYVTCGHPRFGAGTDSAPHPEGAKSRPCGCAAGIFTAPNAVELYAQAFDEDGALNHLQNFLSVNFVEIYGMSPSEQMMTIKRDPFFVPEKIGDVHVFRGGTTLPWKLVS